MSTDYEGPDRRVRARGSVGRRHSDRKGPRHRRDFWLFLVTIFVLLALKSGQDTNDKVARNQRISAHNTSVAVDRIGRLARQVARYQESNTRALCSFRNDLQTRVNSGNDFLRKHPEGFAGIPAATIRVSITNQQHTLDALKPLVCPKPKKQSKPRRK